ncbi:ATP synthase subunit C-domain-containing protein [Pterulicium gracile]|uniref:V-type proton ATPase proteolipid subunit n=1 Tax=Pterulicium gracile TaxID=1884261 RepID=A0A5C3QGK9_9AGAR|nr:ATP synthase subunit C-domain-containing protein [Pterula gracilis]
MGCASAIVFASFGASYGTAKSFVGIASSGVLRPDKMIQFSIPVVMAGILAIYGLVVSVVITQDLKPGLLLSLAFHDLGAGLSVGFSCLAAGFAIGIVGDSGVRASAQQPKLFVSMLLMLNFAELWGLYGMIVALLLHGKAGSDEFRGLKCV